MSKFTLSLSSSSNGSPFLAAIKNAHSINIVIYACKSTKETDRGKDDERQEREREGKVRHGKRRTSWRKEKLHAHSSHYIKDNMAACGGK